MGLFSSSNLTVEEKEKLKTLKRELKRYSEHLCAYDVVRCLEGASEDLTKSTLKLLKYRDSEYFIKSCLENYTSAEILDTIMADLLSKTTLSYISGTSEVTPDIFKVLDKYRDEIFLPYDSFLETAVSRAIASKPADIELVDLIVQRIKQKNETCVIEGLKWQNIPEYFAENIDTLVSISYTDKASTVQYLIDVNIGSDSGNHPAVLDTILKYAKDQDMVDSLNFDHIVKYAHSRDKMMDVLKFLNISQDQQNRYEQEYALKRNDLSAILELNLDGKDAEIIEKCLLNILCDSTAIEKIAEAEKHGFKWSMMRADFLAAHLPALAKSCGDEDFEKLAKKIEGHTDAQKIFRGIAEEIKNQTSHFEKYKLCFPHCGYSKDHIFEMLQDDLQKRRTEGFDTRHLVLFMVKQIDEIGTPPESLIREIACGADADTINAMVDKGLFFGKHIKMARDVSMSHNSGSVDELLKKIDKDEKLNKYPFWEKLSDEVIEERSVYRSVSGEKTIFLSRQFNFRAGIMETVYETYEGSNLTELTTGHGWQFTDLNSEFVKDAEKRLKDLGGLPKLQTSAVKAVAPPKAGGQSG